MKTTIDWRWAFEMLRDRLVCDNLVDNPLTDAQIAEISAIAESVLADATCEGDKE